MEKLPRLEQFLTHVLVERSGSIHTQKSYTRDLKIFSDFLEVSGSELLHFSQFLNCIFQAGPRKQLK